MLYILLLLLMAITDEKSEDRKEIKNEMPKDGKKGRKRQNLLSVSDVTLHDFADCPRPQSCSRVKKSVANSTAPGVITKISSVQKALEKEGEDELSWFEKDLEQFTIEDPPNLQEDDLSALGAALSADKEKKKGKNTSCSVGVVYPQDIWFLISDYIQPEDVGTFSRICQGAHSITQTAAFWRRLYERLDTKGKEGLPNHLKPHSMERVHGLRARVIQSFFILCPAVSARVQIKDDPHDLKGHRCLLAWHQPATKGWQFCFKFQKPYFHTSRPASRLDVYHGYNDLFYNPEEGCSVLQVTCCHFASVAPVMGLLLSQVYVTLSTGFRHHRLRLHFDSCVSASQNASDTVVILDDVLSIKDLQWWHPGYPFQT